MRFLSAIVGAFLVTASAQAVASPPVMAVEPAAQAELTVETKVLSVETRAPATAEGTETTEVRCAVTRIIQDKSGGKDGIRVGTQLSVLGTCQRMTKPLEANMAGYPSDRCDAGAWTAPFWMKQQKKDQVLTLYLKHPIDEKTKKPIAGTLETVAERQPAPRAATVTVVKTDAAKKQ